MPFTDSLSANVNEECGLSVMKHCSQKKMKKKTCMSCADKLNKTEGIICYESSVAVKSNQAHAGICEYLLFRGGST